MHIQIAPSRDSFADVSAALLQRADFTVEKLIQAVAAGEKFLIQFREAGFQVVKGGSLHGTVPDKAQQKFIRQSGGIAGAVVSKLGSNSIAKRRPDDIAPFLDYVRRRHDIGAPLLLRLGAGPVKNVHHYGAQQTPDLAEFLMFTQLARVASAVTALYPHGVKVQMVPDDKRGGAANQWPPEYGARYIGGLQKLVKTMGFDGWLQIENGQTRLYEQYKVAGFRSAAEEHFRDWAKTDPAAYHAKLERAASKARDNMVTTHGRQPATPAEARDSALRYLIALKAEELSGIFAPRDAFPLRYGHHPDSFQLYTMGQGQTKLPWQIALPPALLQHPPSSMAEPRPYRPIAMGQNGFIPCLMPVS